jgi:hypothetical protein
MADTAVSKAVAPERRESSNLSFRTKLWPNGGMADTVVLEATA